MARKKADNGAKLRVLIEATGLTQAQALLLLNAVLDDTLSESTWKAYLAAPSSARRRLCPQSVFERAEGIFGKIISRQQATK